jgi:hypothetical protein
VWPQVDVGGQKDGRQIALKTRAGKIIPVDMTVALNTGQAIPTVGAAVEVRGHYYVRRNVLLATSVQAVSSAPESWGADR